MDKYQGMVYAEALKFTRNPDEAEDLTQEIFLKAFESLSLFHGKSKFPTWLYRIGKNLAFSKYRENKKNPLSTREDLNPDALIDRRFEDSAKHIEDETTNRLRLLLSKLPLAYKKPIVLYYFENMSYKEIADHLDIKMNTLKSYILRGKDLLKKWMDHDE